MRRALMRGAVCAVGTLFHLVLAAQPLRDSATYRLARWVDGPIMVGTAAAVIGGAITMQQQEPLSVQLVYSLDQASVNGFDQRSFHIDVTESLDARHRSDVVLGSSVIAPLLLGLDPRVRRQYGPLVLLYCEAMLVNSSVQTWTAVGVGRYRPMAYLPEASLAQRVDRTNHNSFFSGHTSATATATFFMARVMDDLHPELGGKRFLLYAAAAVPPALAGWYRVRAGKHFPTDVITGFAFGAAVGILVPGLHKSGDDRQVYLMPIALPQGLGLAMSWRW